MTDSNYNGYRNYETFSIAVVIINDQDMLNQYQEVIDGLEDAKAMAIVKRYIDFNNPLADTSTFYGCLLNSALEKVDWLEVVEAIRPEA